MNELSFADERAPLFLGATRAFVPHSSVLFGVGYDGTTSFRPGARFGPDAIRLASEGLETYSPRRDADLEDIDVVDAGNLDIPFGAPAPVLARVGEAVAEILERQARPVMLGGEHSLTAGAVRAAAAHFPDLAVIQLDAHADLRADYLGEEFSHACAIRRCLDVVDSERVLQVGIRSGTRQEFDEMRRHDRLVAPDPGALAERVASLGGRPVYLTVDLDVFDPSQLPGTGTPEPGGIDWACFEALLDVVAQLDIVACDVMELAPQLDPSGVSAILAAKVVRELLLI